MTVFFDIGATLIEGPSESPSRQLATRFGFDNSTKERIENHILTKNITSIDQLADYLFLEFGITKNAAYLSSTYVWDSQIINPVSIKGGKSLLRGLQASGVDYGFISNIWFPYAQTFSRLYGKLALSELTFFSYKVGLTKPDPSFYRLALASTIETPESCVMIGDSYENDIVPALSLGMKTIWVQHRKKKEEHFLHDVESGKLPSPTLIIPSISDLTLKKIQKVRCS